jgi:branched-chain amino acid transport system permease protein
VAHTFQLVGYFQSYQLTWSYFLDQLVAGLTLGSLYGLMAIGYSMVYGVLKLLNFAHGEVFMIGSYIGYFVLVALGGALSPEVPVALLIFLMLGAAMIGSGVLGVTVERFAYRPLRKAHAPRIAPLISALGVSFCLQQLASIFFGTNYEQYNPFGLSGGTLTTPWHVGALEMSWMQVFVILFTAFLMFVLWQLVTRTQIGRAMRAVSFDLEAASMMGIDVDRVISVTFFIGSALAGAAGVMFALVFGQIYHFMGFIAGLKGFTAAVIGGIGSIPGAMAGGLIVGLAESYATGYLPQGSTFQNLYVFALLILVILIRPSGLFGRAAINKV